MDPMTISPLATSIIVLLLVLVVVLWILWAKDGRKIDGLNQKCKGLEARLGQPITEEELAVNTRYSIISKADRNLLNYIFVREADSGRLLVVYDSQIENYKNRGSQFVIVPLSQGDRLPFFSPA